MIERTVARVISDRGISRTVSRSARDDGLKVHKESTSTVPICNCYTFTIAMRFPHYHFTETLFEP